MYMLLTNCAVNMGLSNGFVWKVRGKAVSAQWCEELAAILGVSRTTGGPGADLWIEQGKFRAGQPFDPSTLLELSSHGVASPRRSYVRAWSDLVLLRHEECAYVIAGLGEVGDREGRIDQMRRAMLPFYEAVAARGGLPLHAALAEIRGQGVILAGVSGAGKSTCSRRFPAPWRILSDDLAVVVPCEDGTLRAHPLPTWSAVKAQTVERPCVLRQSVPVRAIFFLVQSDTETAVPVGAGRAALSIYDAAMQVFMSVDFASGIPGGSTYTRTLFENAAEMAAALPAFVLHVSLRGCFWECIERALDQVGGAVYKKRENNFHKLSAGKWGQTPL
jgi:SynChlorMet cassette protein ScmC